MTRIRPIIKWNGGKSRMLEQLLPLIPPHKCYVELFAGGAALLLARPQPKGVEVINDINHDLVTLYRVCQYHMEPLIEELEWIISARQNLTDYIEQRGLTDIQRSARWLARNWMSFAAGGTSYGVQRQGGGGACSSRAYVRDKIRAFNERMDRVSVENLPWDRCLALYDSPDTFFFIDPPYLDSDCNCYAGWAEADFLALYKALKSIQGKWLLTTDDSSFQRDLWAEHQIRPVETKNGATKAAARQSFGELIISPASPRQAPGKPPASPRQAPGKRRGIRG